MPNYKEMYLKMMRASSIAVNIIVAAQRECEELYLEQDEPDLQVVSLPQAAQKETEMV